MWNNNNNGAPSWNNNNNSSSNNNSYYYYGPPPPPFAPLQQQQQQQQQQQAFLPPVYRDVSQQQQQQSASYAQPPPYNNYQPPPPPSQRTFSLFQPSWKAMAGTPYSSSSLLSSDSNCTTTDQQVPPQSPPPRQVSGTITERQQTQNNNAFHPQQLQPPTDTYNTTLLQANSPLVAGRQKKKTKGSRGAKPKKPNFNNNNSSSNSGSNNNNTLDSYCLPRQPPFEQQQQQQKQQQQSAQVQQPAHAISVQQMPPGHAVLGSMQQQQQQQPPPKVTEHTVLGSLQQQHQSTSAKAPLAAAQVGQKKKNQSPSHPVKKTAPAPPISTSSKEFQRAQNSLIQLTALVLQTTTQQKALLKLHKTNVTTALYTFRKHNALPQKGVYYIATNLAKQVQNMAYEISKGLAITTQSSSSWSDWTRRLEQLHRDVEHDKAERKKDQAERKKAQTEQLQQQQVVRAANDNKDLDGDEEPPVEKLKQQASNPMEITRNEQQRLATDPLNDADKLTGEIEKLTSKIHEKERLMAKSINEKVADSRAEQPVQEHVQQQQQNSREVGISISSTSGTALPTNTTMFQQQLTQLSKQASLLETSFKAATVVPPPKNQAETRAQNTLTNLTSLVLQTTTLEKSHSKRHQHNVQQSLKAFTKHNACPQGGVYIPSEFAKQVQCMARDILNNHIQSYSWTSWESRVEAIRRLQANKATRKPPESTSIWTKAEQRAKNTLRQLSSLILHTTRQNALFLFHVANVDTSLVAFQKHNMRPEGGVHCGSMVAKQVEQMAMEITSGTIGSDWDARVEQLKQDVQTLKQDEQQSREQQQPSMKTSNSNKGNVLTEQQKETLTQDLPKIKEMVQRKLQSMAIAGKGTNDDDTSILDLPAEKLKRQLLYYEQVLVSAGNDWTEQEIDYVMQQVQKFKEAKQGKDQLLETNRGEVDHVNGNEATREFSSDSSTNNIAGAAPGESFVDTRGETLVSGTAVDAPFQHHLLLSARQKPQHVQRDGLGTELPVAEPVAETNMLEQLASHAVDTNTSTSIELAASVDDKAKLSLKDAHAEARNKLMAACQAKKHALQRALPASLPKLTPITALAGDASLFIQYIDTTLEKTAFVVTPELLPEESPSHEHLRKRKRELQSELSQAKEKQQRLSQSESVMINRDATQIALPDEPGQPPLTRDELMKRHREAERKRVITHLKNVAAKFDHQYAVQKMRLTETEQALQQVEDELNKKKQLAAKVDQDIIVLDKRRDVVQDLIAKQMCQLIDARKRLHDYKQGEQRSKK